MKNTIKEWIESGFWIVFVPVIGMLSGHFYDNFMNPKYKGLLLYQSFCGGVSFWLLIGRPAFN